MMKWIVMLGAALIVAQPLHAGSASVHKCSGDGGATAYRSEDCRAGESLVATIEPAPEIHAPVRTGPSATADRSAAAGSRLRSSRAGHRTATRSVSRSRKPRRPRKNPCQGAKQARDDFQRRRGIHITMAELSRWNHRVYDACK